MGGRKRKRTAAVRTRDPDNVAATVTTFSLASTAVPSTIRAMVGADGIVMTLPDFVAWHAPSLPPLDLDGCTDGDRIRRTMVSPSSSVGILPVPEITTASRSQTLIDLVDEVIWSLVQRKSRDWSQRNVLDQGYNASSSRRDHHQQCPNMRPGVVCTHINDNVTFCKTSSYAEALHRLLGDVLMRTLLLHTSVFLPVEGSTDNFILLCGPGNARSGKQRKRKNCKCDNTDNAANGWKANDTIPWQSLLYSQTYTPKVGFQTHHIMNQNDPSKLLGAIVNLYSSSGKKRRKRWKRLRHGALPMCERILRRHAECDYHRTLNRFCPLPDFAKLGTKVQVDLAEVGASHTSVKKVVQFLQAVIRKVLPLEFWGTQRNADRVLSILDTFVSLRRGERFPNKTLMDGLRVKDIRWMWAEDHSKSSHEAATALLRETMRWVVCGFTIPLLRSIFYVTESEIFGKCILYYRKPVWSIFRSLSISKLTSTQYQEITQKQTAALLEGQQMGLSRLKLLPKASGVRPIAMLSRRDTLIGNESESIGFHPSTNTILANTFRVLRHEYERNPHSFGAGQVGLDGVYTILKSFLRKVRSYPLACSKMTSKKFYFVSVDIEKCYDNVNQHHLQRIIEKIVQQDQYLIQNYSVMQPFSSLGRPVWKPLTLVGGLNEYERFHAFSTRLSTQYTNAVFSNTAGCVIIKKQDIMAQLAEHLHRNLLAMPGRFGKRYFLQKSGIPQGSVLSSFLCNYYYGKMEKIILGKILEHASESALIRIMDDFLFITTDRRLAEVFLERMKVGKPELGVCINNDKSMSNLAEKGDETKQLLFMSGRTFFAWCGWLFDTMTGEVRIDYSRFSNTKALDALTIERRQVGRNLEIQMKAFVRPRCQPILFDASINSFDVIVINFTQMMLLAALKSQEVIRSVIDIDKNLRFLRHAIKSTVLFARNLIIRRLKQRANKGTGLCFGEQEALWLGRYAFQWVFKREDVAALSVKSDWRERRSRLTRAAHLARAEFLVMTVNEP